MPRKHDDVITAVAVDPATRKWLDALQPATLKQLRKRAGQTQEELAAALGVGQDTISRLEQRNDMLLSTLRHYVESIGGQLALVALFPDEPPVVIDHRGDKNGPHKRGP